MILNWIWIHSPPWLLFSILDKFSIDSNFISLFKSPILSFRKVFECLFFEWKIASSIILVLITYLFMFLVNGWCRLDLYNLSSTRWEEDLGCFILSGHFSRSCQKFRMLTGKSHLERRLYTLWSLSLSFWYAVSYHCMEYTLQQVLIHSIGCVLFLPQAVELWWSWGSPQLWLLDWWCNSWLGQRLLKWTTMCARIVLSCKYPLG